MDGIKIQVTGNIAKVIEKPKRLIAGTIGLPVEFFFDETWDDIVKTAVFVAGENVSRLDEIDGKTTVPWEVLQNPGPWLSIGVYGESSDGEKSIPTTWANVSPILFGTSLSGDPTDPSAAPIWQKLKDEMENVRGLVEEGYISNASINKNGELELTFLDDSVVNVGKVVGETPAVADDLYTKDSTKALSANMGAVLREKIDTDLLSVQKKLQAEIKQRVKTVNGVAPDENGNVVVEVPEGGGGCITVAEKELILSLFKNTAYTADMSATISRLESLWSGSGDEPDAPVEPDIPDEPDVIMHNITKKLDGVSASNSATSVVDGASYVCNLTANDGYTLDGAEVSVAMGGRDITSTAYSIGVINIASVTGDVDITVVAKEILIYSVTNNLTGVTNSNPQTEVTEGFYSASLSWKAGYALNSIVITMGGVDITDQVYGEGSILITEVTGDIVITAEAGIPVLYQLANTPVTCNADLYESTGLTSGASDATLVTKPWTLCAKFVRPGNDCNILAATNDETNTGFTIRSNVSYVGHFPRVGWCKGVVNCDVANGTVSKIVVVHEANANWSVKVYSEVGGGVAKTVSATYNNMTDSYYAGELYVGGATAANFIGTIYDFTIYGAVLSEDEIKAYLGVA